MAKSVEMIWQNLIQIKKIFLLYNKIYGIFNVYQYKKL